MKKEFLEKALENDIRTDMLSYIDWHDLNQKNICDEVFGHEFDYEDLDEIVDKKNTYNEFVGIDKIETRESIIEQMQGIVDRYNESIKNESAEFKAMYTKNVKCWIYDKQ